MPTTSRHRATSVTSSARLVRFVVRRVVTAACMTGAVGLMTFAAHTVRF